MHDQSITLKLDLPEFAVQGTVTDQSGDLLVIVTAKSLPACPDCGGGEASLHDRRKQWVEDRPLRDQRVFLLCEKRRFRCTRCGVLFSEKYPSLARYGRCTKRMAEWLFKLCRTRSIAQVAAEIGWTRPRLDRLFHRLATAEIEQRQQEVPEAIGIDEFAVLRRHQYHTVITDLNGRSTHEILEGRSKRTIRDFLHTLQDPGRVKIVVTDMWDAYRQALRSYLPHALHIVDKFHVVRHANWAVDQVRRRGRKGRNASTKSPWWKARWHLLRKQEALTERQMERVKALLQEDELLRRAYDLKERLRHWYQHKSLERAATEFPNLVQAMLSSDIPEYKTLARTLLAWRSEILAYFMYPYTNGFTEGTNTKIKLLKRIGYGIPSFQKLRNRILSYK
jgi:transposase